LNWVSHTFSFVATGASSTLRFADPSNGGAAAGLNWALDDVSVSGVLEPGAVGLMSVGLAALAFLRRANRRACASRQVPEQLGPVSTGLLCRAGVRGGSLPRA
jgi:hypothetical protein